MYKTFIKQVGNERATLKNGTLDNISISISLMTLKSCHLQNAIAPPVN